MGQPKEAPSSETPHTGVENQRNTTRSSLRKYLLAALLVHAPVVALSNSTVRHWVNTQIEHSIEGGRRVRARSQLKDAVARDAEQGRFQPAAFLVNAEGIERSMTPVQIRQHLVDQDTLFAEVQRLQREKNLSDIDVVRRVTAERYRYNEGQQRVTGIKEDSTFNCTGFTLQGAILFLRLGTPNIYIEAFQPIGRPPISHVALVWQHQGRWYDIRDGKITPPPDVSKLVPLRDIWRHYRTMDQATHVLARDTGQALFDFPAQDFGYPGGVIFRSPPAGRAQWNERVAVATASNASTVNPVSDGQFLDHMVDVWLTDFVHNTIAPTPYGSVSNPNTENSAIEVDFIGTPSPSPTSPSSQSTNLQPVTSSDLPSGPLEQTAEDATGFANIFNQAVNRLARPATDDRTGIERGRVLSNLVAIAQTRLERASDLTPSERDYLESVIQTARREREEGLNRNEDVRINADIRASVADESTIASTLLRDSSRRVTFLRRELQANERHGLFPFGVSGVRLRVVPYLFLPETRSELVAWAQRNGPGALASLIVGFRSVLHQTVNPDPLLETRIAHQLQLDQIPEWQAAWTEINELPHNSYDELATEHDQFLQVDPLFNALMQAHDLTPLQKAALTFQVNQFIRVYIPGGHPAHRRRLEQIIFSAWYHQVGSTPPTQDQGTTGLWASTQENNHPSLAATELQEAWQGIRTQILAN